MNSNATPIPRKKTKISFRTDESTFAKLKAYCRIENRTISSLIENVLMDHVLRLENPLPLHGDKRQSPRKECSLETIIYPATKDKNNQFNGKIVNISASSIQILLKQHKSDKLFFEEFYTLFSIPNHDNPILSQCKLVRSNFLHEEHIIVAKFVKIENYAIKAINKYLSVFN